MTARAIRRSVRLVPDFREHSNTSLQISLRNIFDQFRAQIVGGIENFLEDRLGASLEVDGFAATILLRPAAFDPAIIFQPVEQTGESRALDAHALGDFLLGECISALGKVDERPPFSLAQAKRAQALVEPGAPGPGRAEKHETEFVDIGRWHSAK